jgi:crossover junction endodeoxyribonuclease RusA
MDAYEFNIEMPWPNPALSPNARIHFRRRASIAAEQKRTWFYMARAAYAPVLTGRKATLPIRLDFMPPDDGRRRDLDNMLASVKSGLDGLALALGVDDNLFEITSRRRGFADGAGKVLVQVWWEMAG